MIPIGKARPGHAAGGPHGKGGQLTYQAVCKEQKLPPVRPVLKTVR